MDYELWDFPESLFASKNGLNDFSVLLLWQLFCHKTNTVIDMTLKKKLMIDGCNNFLRDEENYKWQLFVRGTYWYGIIFQAIPKLDEYETQIS